MKIEVVFYVYDDENSKLEFEKASNQLDLLKSILSHFKYKLIVYDKLKRTFYTTHHYIFSTDELPF